jgi:hypothetical protein
MSRSQASGSRAIARRNKEEDVGSEGFTARLSARFVGPAFITGPGSSRRERDGMMLECTVVPILR